MKEKSEDLTGDKSLSTILIIDGKKLVYVYIYTQKHTQWILVRGAGCNHGKPVKILSLSVITFQVHFTRVSMSLDTGTDLPSFKGVC